MNLRKIMLIVIGSSVFLGLAFTLILAILGEGWSLHFQVKEFYVCGGKDEITGRPLEPIQTITLSTTMLPLYACGLVETDGRPTKLQVYVRNHQAKLVDYSPRNSEFGPGYFFYKITFDERLHSGDYSIYLYKGRTLLSTYMLSVIDR